jgi:hypothetical protein
MVHRWPLNKRKLITRDKLARKDKFVIWYAFSDIKPKFLTICFSIASGSIVAEGVCHTMFVKLGSDYKSIARLLFSPKKNGHINSIPSSVVKYLFSRNKICFQGLQWRNIFHVWCILVFLIHRWKTLYKHVSRRN